MATVVTVITIEFEFNEIVGVIGQGVTDTPHYTDTKKDIIIVLNFVSGYRFEKEKSIIGYGTPIVPLDIVLKG